jgi:hypothetical protein
MPRLIRIYGSPLPKQMSSRRCSRSPHGQSGYDLSGRRSIRVGMTKALLGAGSSHGFVQRWYGTWQTESAFDLYLCPAYPPVEPSSLDKDQPRR